MMEFIVNNLDLIFVPAGVILFLSTWIFVVVRIILKFKKGELQFVPADSSMFDTSPSSSSCWSLNSDIYTNPAYSSLSVNIYNQDRWKSS